MKIEIIQFSNSSFEIFSNEFGQLIAYFILNAVKLNRLADNLVAGQMVTAGNGMNATVDSLSDSTNAIVFWERMYHKFTIIKIQTNIGNAIKQNHQTFA